MAFADPKKQALIDLEARAAAQEIAQGPPPWRQRFLEKLVEYLFGGGTLGGIPEYVATHFTWHRFAAIQIRIFVLFLVYTSVEKLNARLGEGELRKIFYSGRSSGWRSFAPGAQERS